MGTIDLYEEVVKCCEQNQKRHPTPPRNRITGMRATEFEDLLFIDHVELVADTGRYLVLVVVDGMSNLVWVGPTKERDSRRDDHDTSAVQGRAHGEP
eukprot:12910724-Prorocentrum_lima.AAC.1